MHQVTTNILCLVTRLVTELFRDAIPNTLMWPVPVEKVFVFIEYVLESVQPQDNQMVQAFFTQTSNPTLSNGVGVGSFVRSFDRLESCAFQQAIKRVQERHSLVAGSQGVNVNKRSPLALSNLKLHLEVSVSVTKCKFVPLMDAPSITL